MVTTQENHLKKCGKCNETKDISCFSQLSPSSKTYKKFKNGIKPWCKECYKTYTRNYMKEKRSLSGSSQDHYLKKYGLTRDEVNLMMEEKNHKCDICGNESDHRYGKLNVDHCHDTGKVRGLLCFSCNVMIGQSKDSTEVLRKAIKYLEKQN